jgi:hypothetical protein
MGGSSQERLEDGVAVKRYNGVQMFCMLRRGQIHHGVPIISAKGRPTVAGAQQTYPPHDAANISSR